MTNVNPSRKRPRTNPNQLTDSELRRLQLASLYDGDSFCVYTAEDYTAFERDCKRSWRTFKLYLSKLRKRWFR